MSDLLNVRIEPRPRNDAAWIGCRCEPCVAAKRARSKAYDTLRRASKAAS